MKRAAVLALSALLTGGFLAPLASVYAGPETLPLVQSSNLEYKGAFRLPRGGNGTTNGFSFGGNAIAFDPANGSLLVSTRESSVGKVRIVEPTISSDIDSLPFATIIQNIRDPLEGGLNVLPESSIRGLLVADSKLYGAASIYYDANNNARVSHFSRSTDLSEVSATPLKPIWQSEKSGYLGGWLSNVPLEWQSTLGGNVLSGNCCIPIVGRTSNGPSAFAWNTSNFASSNLVPATPLVYYTLENATLGPWNGANATYGGTTSMGGMVIPNGTRSLLYFGLNGTGTFCYGSGTATQTLAGTNDPDGHPYCYDPYSSAKGQHAYPYNYQVWAYNLNDLAAVKSGTKNPWDVTPYSVWNLTLPNSFVSLNGFGGVTYDPVNQFIYVSQAEADRDGYSSRALIHVFKVNIGSSSSYSTPYATPYETPYATPYTTPPSSSSPYTTPASSSSAGPSFNASDVVSTEIGGGDPIEDTISTSNSTLAGESSKIKEVVTLAEEARRKMIVEIMIKIIELLKQLMIQMQTQAASVISAINSWGL